MCQIGLPGFLARTAACSLICMSPPSRTFTALIYLCMAVAVLALLKTILGPWL